MSNSTAVRKYHSKKIVPILLLALFVPGLAWCLEVPTLYSRVNDYAGMFSVLTRSQVENDLRALEQSDSTQIAVLAIPSLEGEDLESFSMEVAHTWKIGHEDTDNGVILLIALEDRKVRIEVGYGLESALTDELAAAIIGNVISPRFKKEDYDEGLSAGVEAMIAVVKGEYSQGDFQPPKRATGKHLWITLLVVVFLVVSLGRMHPIFGLFIGAVIFGIASLSLNLHPLWAVGFVCLGTMLGYIFCLVNNSLPASHHASMCWFGGSRGGGLGSGWFGGRGSDGGGFSGGGGGFGGGGASGSW